MNVKPLKIGIIGGGQLGMFLAQSANKLNIQPYVYSNTKDAPAKKYALKMFYGDFNDESKLSKFIEKVDLLTYEFENISINSLQKLGGDKNIYPPLKALSITQDRKKEKEFFSKYNINHAKTYSVKTEKEILKIKSKIKYPAIIKTSRFGYDGKGQIVINSLNELRTAWIKLNKKPCVIEEKINLKKELSIVMAQDKSKNIKIFPSFRNIHKNHILHKTYTPSGINMKLEKRLIEISTTIMKHLKYVGVLTIEFFIDNYDKIYVNELAPRVHNSGHITLNTFNFSQFDLHMIAVAGRNLPNLIRLNDGLMLNLIGNDIKLSRSIKNSDSFSKYKKVKSYLYGKKQINYGRKMGHMNFYEKK
jgi:5-(carboxyamino)imidazole ribonucleotide synthase